MVHRRGEVTLRNRFRFRPDRDPVLRHVRIGELIAEVCDEQAMALVQSGIRVEVDATSQTLLADPTLLRQALWHLICNAIDAMPDGGELVITAFQSQDVFEVEIADTGPGLGKQALEALFQPYCSTKPNRAGLGLWVVQGIVAAHGGDIQAVNCPEGGAAFTLRLPSRILEAVA